MNAGRDVERLISDWLAYEAPVRAPDRVLESAGTVIDRTKQRRFLAAWRERFMELTIRRAVVPRPLIYLATLGLLVVALVAALVLVGASQRRLPEPFGPASNGAIAFDAGGDIYLAGPDGTDHRLLGGGLGHSFSPAFSPDGTRIAFWSKERSQQSVHLLVGPADGSAPAALVSGNVAMVDPEFVAPAWSPDGTRIAFTGYHEAGAAIYVAKADGTGVAPIAVGGIRTGYPAWSPDGRWIAYRGETDATSLHVVSPDGQERRELQRVDGVVDAFTLTNWSPDATRIAYHRPGEQHAVVAVTDLQGNETVVSDASMHAERPAWSPDGRQLAYVSETAGVLVVGADGTNRRSLGKVASCSVWFSPDGKYLIGYPSGECFGDQLVLVPLDNPGATRPVQLPATTLGVPAWQRVGD